MDQTTVNYCELGDQLLEAPNYNHSFTTKTDTDSESQIKIEYHEIINDYPDVIKKEQETPDDIHLQMKIPNIFPQRVENDAAVANCSAPGSVKMKSVHTQVSPRRMKPTTREAALQGKIKMLQDKLRRTDVKIFTMSQLVKDLKKSDQSYDVLENI